MTRTPTCLLLLLLAGCASTPETAHETVPRAGSTLFSWTPLVDADTLSRFGERCATYRSPEDRALLVALVRDGGELGHALFLSSEDESLRSALAEALGPAHRASEAARASAPAPHAAARAAYRDAVSLAPRDAAQASARASAAASGFGAVGDSLRAIDAQLLAGSLALELGEDPAAPPAVAAAEQQAPLALLSLGIAWRQGTLSPRAFRATARVATRAPHVAVLRRLEAIRSLGITQPTRGEPSFSLEWSEALARAAIVRRQPLLAIRHGLEAVRASEALQRPTAPARTRLAQAYLVAGKRDSAVIEAQTAVDAARSPSHAAAAASVLGEALIASGEFEAAAESYTRAQRSAEQAGDGLGAFRAGLNRGLAFVRARDLESAGEALGALTVLPSGPGAADLRARHRVATVLFELLSKQIPAEEAAERIDSALAEARAAGCAEVLAAYGSLPARLRP